MKKRLRLLAFIGVAMMVVSMCACQGMPSDTITSSAKSTTASTASSAVTTTNSTAITTTTTVLLKPSITDTPTDADDAAKYVKEPSLPAAYNKSVHSALFADPTARYRIHYMRHDCTTSSNPTPAQYHEQGAGGVVINDVWGSRYLDYMPVIKKMSNFVQQLKASNMNVWIYDENVFPSGSAGGLVLKDNPEYQSQGISCLSKTGNGKRSVTWGMPSNFESIVSAYAVDSKGNTHKAKVSGRTVVFDGADGDWTLYMIVMSRMHEQTVASNSGAFREMPNLLDKRAVAKFIEYTHAYYAKYIQNFGDNITAFFTDEPNTCESILLGTIPHAKISWCEELEDRFKAKWGYDIATNYHSLFAGDSYKDQQVRTNYREIVGELFAENYTGQISEYLAQYGILSSGHLTLEENIVNHVANYGNYMHALSGMSAPGVDVCIGGYTAYMNEILGDWTVTNHFMSAKYGGSVGRLKNSDLVMVEFCPIETEDGKFQSKNDQYAITNNVFFSGINHINSYSQNWNMVENGVNYSADYADYTARMSYMLRNSEFDTPLGVYYPIETMQANFKGMTMHLQDQMPGARGTKMQKTLMALTKAIWSNQMEHTFIDADSILNAKIQGKALVINGFAVECLIMPRTEVLSVKVAEKLNAWKQAGGTVIWLEEKAAVSAEVGKEATLQALLKNDTVTATQEEAVAKAKAVLNETLKVTAADTTELFVSRHKLQDSTMYFVVNNRTESNKVTLSYEGAKSFDIYDNETGKITTVSGSNTTVDIAACRSIFVVVKQ
ncbi:MAG: hypothetical protein IJW89_02875 [Clostridia bacterium]|nr:hypothetical protein [Clostridia bacterium]